jgi:tetratricopeptide (TPR) repeat protein
MFTAASPFSSSFRVLLLALVLSAGFTRARADDKPRPELTEATSDKLQDLKALEDATPPKLDEAAALVDSLLATAGPTSFDRAVLARIKTTYLFRKNDQAARFAAIELLQTALSLSDTYGYFEAKDAQQLRFYIANLCFERGSVSKDPAAQHADYDTARTVIEKWLEIAKTDPTAPPSPSPAPDSLENAEMFYAQLLYTMAEFDSKHVDLDLVKKALDETEKALRSAAIPNENLYILKLATLQQLGNYDDAADALEFILKSKPDNKSYWQQLTAFYAVLANNAEKAKDAKKSFEYNLRAIVTIERAHKYGAMTSPEDNFELFSLYFNIGQYQQGAELLETGLHDGTIKSTQKNWILLADAYQQMHKDLKAVEVLHETAKHFPESGQFNYLAAQILYGLNKTSEALADIQACVSRDGGEKPAQSWLFYAYLAIELQKFEQAGQAVESAAKCPHTPADDKTIASLREAVKSAIAQRDAAFQRTE